MTMTLEEVRKQLLKEVGPVADKPGPSGDTDKSKNVSNSGHGNSAAYRIAKLKRDHPKIAARLEAGEFKFVTDAERAAGIRGGKMTAVDRVVRAYKKLSVDEQEAVLEQVNT